MSIRDVAKETDISQIHVSRIERLESSPTEEKIRSLARFFRVPVGSLFGDHFGPSSPDTQNLIDSPTTPVNTNLLRQMIKDEVARQLKR